MAQVRDDVPVEINISMEKVCFIISKAREYDGKVDPVEPDPGSNPTDSDEREILSDYPDDPTADELTEAINDLNDDEVIDLIAMVWIGRGDFGKSEWKSARSLARERHHRKSAAYLMGMPTLGDFLEEGASQLGYSCSEYDLGRL